MAFGVGYKSGGAAVPLLQGNYTFGAINVAAGVSYLYPGPVSAASSTISPLLCGAIPIPLAGVLSYYGLCQTNPGGAVDIDYEWYINGASTGWTQTYNTGNAVAVLNTSTTLAVSAGDLLQLRANNPGSLAGIRLLASLWYKSTQTL